MNDLAKVENNSLSTQTENPYLDLMSKVVEKGDMSQLEKLMQMQMQWEANEAKKAYVRALTSFKANAPTITKDTQGHNCKYATLAQVAGKVAATLSDYGLSHSWSTSQEGNAITVACVITHELGHSESISLTAAPDDSGKKNSIQAIGSTVSYLERYTLLAATGLAAQEQDNDGGKPVELVTEQDIKQITELAEEKGVNMDKVLAAYMLSDISELPRARFASVIERLKKSEGSK